MKPSPPALPVIRHLIFVLLLACPAFAQPAPKELPTDWTDPDTGHRVVRLSREDGSQSLYFHQNGYTPDGKKLVITSPGGISAIDLQTHQIDRLVDGRLNLIMVGRKTGRI